MKYFRILLLLLTFVFLFPLTLSAQTQSPEIRVIGNVYPKSRFLGCDEKKQVKMLIAKQNKEGDKAFRAQLNIFTTQESKQHPNQKVCENIDSATVLIESFESVRMANGINITIIGVLTTSGSKHFTWTGVTVMTRKEYEKYLKDNQLGTQI